MFVQLTVAVQTIGPILYLSGWPDGSTGDHIYWHYCALGHQRSSTINHSQFYQVSEDIRPLISVNLTHLNRAAKSHTGVYLASQVSNCLHEYGIYAKVSLYI
jgi:hypothetical protein